MSSEARQPDPETLEDVCQWLTTSKPSFQRQVALQVAQEPKVERTIKDTVSLSSADKQQRHPDVDYGYTFGGLDPIRQECLKYIHTLSVTGDEKQQLDCKRADMSMADIGAGLGTMTWKMLLAANNGDAQRSVTVDAIEIQNATAKEMERRLQNMSSYWSPDQLHRMLKVYSVDVLSLAALDFASKYDVIWVGNLLHLCKPDQVKRLVEWITVALKPGTGRVFVECNTPWIFGQGESAYMQNADGLIETYQDAKSNKAEFPGFVGKNCATLISLLTGQIQLRTVVSVNNAKSCFVADAVSCDTYGKGYLSGASSGQDSLGEAGRLIDEQLDLLSACLFCHVNRFHSIMNLMDAETLTEQFTAKRPNNNPGLECVETFYLDGGVRCKSLPDKKGRFVAGVFAKKAVTI